MTKLKHTHGPWYLDAFDKLYILAKREAGPDVYVAIAEDYAAINDDQTGAFEGRYPKTEQEAIGNAELIAMAPAMYDLLLAVRRHLADADVLFEPGDDGERNRHAMADKTLAQVCALLTAIERKEVKP